MNAIPPESPPKTQPGQPNWAQDGADWPNRAHSRFVAAGGITWHVQIAGSGPVLLLIHGTGAATHSWRDLLIPLSENFTVVAPDLPGHGFTQRPDNAAMSLPGMADGIAALCTRLGLAPDYAAGHSAGAAILIQAVLDRKLAPKRIISLNGALLPLAVHGIAAPLLGPFAKLFAANPFVPILFAWQAADGRVIQRLLAGTGSALDAYGTKLYARLARRSGHAGAALTMMANWDLAGFAARLPQLQTPLLLVVGENDKSIPPADALRVQRILPFARIRRLPALGHLAHEERPEDIARLIQEACA